MILVAHNILWSKYKGGVFSALHTLATRTGFHIEFLQIAETEIDRVGLAGVDLSYHQYPYKLLFKGSYSDVPMLLLAGKLFLEVWRSRSEFILLPGYHLPEYWAMLFAARLRRKTVGVFCDSTAFDRPHSFLKGLLKRTFFSQCNAFFGYGLRSREYLISYGVPSDQIYFRCQAAALPHDYNVSNVLTARANSHIGDMLRFLYVGRLSPEKNLEDLLRAFKTVLSIYSDARLVLVGSGPLKPYLMTLADQLGLDESIEFAGAKNVEGLRDEYLKACCLVLPSSSEPWGLVVNEALSYGCPVIVSHRCGCVPELVKDGMTGYVFECGNVDELAAKMIEAPRTFFETTLTAKQCTDLISGFSPQAAAQQILDGCLAALAKSK
jgi:glycosyltransferase involved in cell wall biosynthesis